MDDKEIIQMYWDRNQDAVLATAEKYGAYCSAISLNILGDLEDAKECVNDTYLRAWNSIPPQKPEKLSAYLGKIVRNISFDLYKKNRALKRGGCQIPLVLDELSEVITDSHLTEDEWNRKELLRLINEFLSDISSKKGKYLYAGIGMQTA